MGFDVFISYPHQDKAVADAACAKLEAEGIRCWIAPRDVPPGAEWAGAIVDAIDQCRAMVLIFSSSANRSKQIHREVQRAFDREVPVVPFRIENIVPQKSLAYYMGPVHWLDALTLPLEQHLQKLAASVQALVRAPTSDKDGRKERILRETEDKWPGARKPRQSSRDALVTACVLGVGMIVAIGVWVAVRPPPGSAVTALKPKDTFTECTNCPEMIVVPAGSFTMGSPASEPGRNDDEDPQHKVTFARQFAVGKFAVTFDEWDACVADGGCNGYEPPDQGWGRGQRPVINVSWTDAKAYVAWLAKKTGKPYRLLSEAEREYVTRAGTTTPFWWGSSISTSQANYDGSFYTYGNGVNSEYKYRGRTVPVDSFAPNSWGLYQVHGNVWDWTEDCLHDSYKEAPADGSAWIGGDCSIRRLRGGSWVNVPRDLRSANRYGDSTVDRSSHIGFRVGRTLTP